MPQVPVYQRSETLRPAFRQGVDVQANAEDFGAAIGRGLSNLGSGVANISTALAAVQAKEAEAKAKDADNALSGAVREALYNPETGFMNAEGKNAVDAWGGFQKRVAELRAEYGKGLTGEAARMYHDASTARINSTLQTGAIHTGSARKQWFQDASQSRLDTFQQDAIATYGDEKAVSKNIAAGLAELRSFGADAGWDGDTLKSKSAEFVSTTRRNVLMRIANDDPVAAETYFNAHKDDFTGQDQYAIEKALKKGLVVEKSKREAARILGVDGGTAPEGVYGPRVVGGGDLTLDLVRDKEGFRSTPYWDVNHYRVGFGSDTITRADGTVVRTRPGMRISRADAERDLKRRVAAEQRQIAGDIGQETWNALTPQAQAGLSSVAYNYGSLPSSVVSAAKTGDPAKIASAIRELGSDNGGINRNRRNHEADIVMGTAGVSGGGMPSFMAMEDELAKIKDPDVREATRKRLNSMMEAYDKQQKAVQKQAEMQLFAVVEQGGTPDDIPLEVRLAAGQSAMTSAWNYHEAKIKRGEPVTDQSLLYQLRKEAATDPQGFAERNLMEYRDRLDNAAFKELTDNQTSALSDSVKSVQTGQVYANAYKQSEGQLEAIGLTTVSKKGGDRQETAKQIAEFQNALHDRIDQFRKKEDRVPNYAETQAMISQLLLPVVISEPIFGGILGGGFGRSETDAFAFQARYRPDGSTVDINVQYEDIPTPIRESILRTLELEKGGKPTPDEVTEYYETIMFGQ